MNASALREAAEPVEDARARRKEFTGLAALEREGSPVQGGQADAVSFSSSTSSSAAATTGEDDGMKKTGMRGGDIPIG